MLGIATLIVTLYIYVLIAWMILGMLVSFNIINGFQPLVRKSMSLLNRVCEPPMAPIRRFVPSPGGIDFAPLILIFLLVFLLELLDVLTHGGNAIRPVVNFITSITVILFWCSLIYGTLGALIALKVMNGYQPLVSRLLFILRQLLQPLLNPFSRILPKLLGIDLSPFALAAAIYIINRLLYSLA